MEHLVPILTSDYFDLIPASLALHKPSSPLHKSRVAFPFPSFRTWPKFSTEPLDPQGYSPYSQQTLIGALGELPLLPSAGLPGTRSPSSLGPASPHLASHPPLVCRLQGSVLPEHTGFSWTLWLKAGICVTLSLSQNVPEGHCLWRGSTDWRAIILHGRGGVQVNYLA